MVDYENDDIHRPPIQDLLAKPPDKILSHGISIFLLVLILILIISNFVKYPDVIRGSALITCDNPPVKIISQTSGRLIYLNKKDNEFVQKDELIGFLESTANYTDVEKLKQILAAQKTFRLEELTLADTIFVGQLGEIQPAYAIFKKARDELWSFYEIDYHNTKKELIYKQFSLYKVYCAEVSRQQKLLQVEMELQNKRYLRDSIIFNSNGISADELDQAKQNLIRKQFQLSGTNAASTQTYINISELEKSLVELELQYKQIKSQLITEYENTLFNLSMAIKQWEQKYALKAPISGNVTLYNLYINKEVKSGELLLAIVHNNQGNIYGRVNISISGLAKVTSSQKVNFKLIHYPHEDFGLLVGTIEEISLVPKDSIYYGRVKLDNGLITSYKKKLLFQQEMVGTAEIITEDKSILQRLFSKLNYVTMVR